MKRLPFTNIYRVDGWDMGFAFGTFMCEDRKRSRLFYGGLEPVPLCWIEAIGGRPIEPQRDWKG